MKPKGAPAATLYQAASVTDLVSSKLGFAAVAKSVPSKWSAAHSFTQAFEHPSPSAVLPSSHISVGATLPSPHTGAAIPELLELALVDEDDAALELELCAEELELELCAMPPPPPVP